MRTFENLGDWQTFRAAALATGETLGFVPTMGALHEGHLSLITQAKKNHDRVLASIFVNPTQFNNPEDLEKYPRPLARDLAALSAIGCDYVIVPNENQIYSDQNRFKVSESSDSQFLCGAYRPGHFEGVLTIMTKLLGLARAEACYMGEKDYQQLHLVQEMSKSFFLSTQIIGCPTVREPSGLAMSSRNERLSAEGREKAALLFKLLKSPKQCDEIRDQLKAAGFEVEYCEERWGRRFIAAHIDGVRLIDNVKINGGH